MYKTSCAHVIYIAYTFSLKFNCHLTSFSTLCSKRFTTMPAIYFQLRWMGFISPTFVLIITDLPTFIAQYKYVLCYIIKLPSTVLMLLFRNRPTRQFIHCVATNFFYPKTSKYIAHTIRSVIIKPSNIAKSACNNGVTYLLAIRAGINLIKD